jgi:hypothetical protein
MARWVSCGIATIVLRATRSLALTTALLGYVGTYPDSLPIAALRSRSLSTSRDESFSALEIWQFDLAEMHRLLSNHAPFLAAVGKSEIPHAPGAMVPNGDSVLHGGWKLIQTSDAVPSLRLGHALDRHGFLLERNRTLAAIPVSTRHD